MTCASRGPVHGLIVDSAPSAGKPQASMQRRGATPIVQRARPTDLHARSVLGPHPTGQQRTTAGRSGHQTFGEPAGRCPYSSVTLYGADGRSGVRVSPPGCREPFGLLPTRRWSPRTGLPLRPSRAPSPTGGAIAARTGRATHVQCRAWPTDLPRPCGRSARRRSSRLIGTFGATVVSDASTSPLGGR